MATIYVDDREDLAQVLRSIINDAAARVKVKIKRLEYEHPQEPGRMVQAGDYCFASPNGPDGMCSVGIERKRVRDMLGSLESGRYAGGQLPAMLQRYDFSFLIVEGFYRPNPANLCIEIPRGKGKWKDTVWGTRSMHFTALDSHLSTLRLHTPVEVIKTRTPQETAMEIFILWHHFASKKWSQHKSHMAFPWRGAPQGHLEPSWFRCLAKEVPGISWERSKQCEQVFRSVQDMFTADWQRWAMIDGITVDRAKKIVEKIRQQRPGSVGRRKF